MPPGSSKSLLLIGPGAHFGAHLARRFSANGFGVGLISQRAEGVRSLASELAKDGIECATATADVRDPAALRAAMHEAAGQLPPLACIIYNVKFSTSAPGLETPPEDLTRALSINVSGALATIQCALPILKQDCGVNPSIILTGGGFKDRPHPDKLVLSVSKAALHSIFLALALPLHREGISLKTVVIDGVVRKTGPLLPSDVADFFWDAHANPHQRRFVYPTRSELEQVSGQLLLGL
jgi:NAD(P)-dependent dehydrogenase (short-subunit alcohol dehydrogenase family)